MKQAETAGESPRCPKHDRILLCPACVGEKGRGKSSAAKRESSRKNAKRPRKSKP